MFSRTRTILFSRKDNEDCKSTMIGDGDEKSALVIQASQLLKAGKFEYARNREIKRELDKAILFSDGVPYLSPEMCLLYKSTDTEREGYQQDFELACKAMNSEQREWLKNALLRLNPQGHKCRESTLSRAISADCQQDFSAKLRIDG